MPSKADKKNSESPYSPEGPHEPTSDPAMDGSRSDDNNANDKNAKKKRSHSPAASTTSSKSTVDEKEEAARKEREAVAALEARLPRPDWYSSDDEESLQTSEEEEVETSDLRKRAEGSLAGLIIFTVFAFVAFVFSLASSCPIPWMRGKGSMKGRQFGVWRAKKGGLPDLKVNNIHDCSQEMQYWQAAAAMSVVATVTTFGAFLSGLLCCVGVGHIGASFALGFYGMSFSLVAWALVAHLYGYNCCNKYKYKDFAHLDAGFALTLIAFVLLLVGLVALGVHFLTYYTKSIHAGKTNPMRFVFFALLIIVAIFNCVGPAYTQWSKDFDLIKCKVTMWHIELQDKNTKLSTFLGRKEYKCSTFTRRMKVVAAFNILSNIFLAIAILNATGGCYSSNFRFPSNFACFVACIMGLVAWIVLVVIRHSHLCTSPIPAGASLWADMGYNGVPSGVDNAQIEYSGYAMKEGFALMVTGWAINLLAGIFNCIFA